MLILSLKHDLILFEDIYFLKIGGEIAMELAINAYKSFHFTSL